LNPEKNEQTEQANPMNNGHSKTPRERILATLRLNHGKLLLWELEKLAGVKRRDVEDLLMLVPRPIAIKYLNGSKKPSTYVLLKDFIPAQPKSQAEAAKTLNQMTPDQYRQYLIDIDRSLKSRLARRGYRRRGISAEEYLA
jgi:hypothetical protein